MSDASDKPAIMVVQASISDVGAYYREYMAALVASGLFARFDAKPLATGTVFEALEGDFDDCEIVAVLEFPTAAAARAFWNSPEYREIAKLRAHAGDFKVGIWRKLAPPPVKVD